MGITLENLELALSQHKNKEDNKYEPYLSKIDDINLRSVIGEELDYGYFTMSADQSTNIGVNLPVKFDTTIENKNIELNPITYGAKLKKGKTYSFFIKIITLGSNNACHFSLKNITINEYIGTTVLPISLNGSSTSNGEDTLNAIYTPSDDCEVCLALKSVALSLPSSIINYSTMIIHEIGRTYIVDPMDIKDEHVVECGGFGFSSAYTSGIALNAYFPFNQVLFGDVALDSSTGLITLHANKTYEIEFNLLCSFGSTTGYAHIGFYNFTQNVEIGKWIMIASNGNNTNIATQHMTKCIFTPTSECQIGIKIFALNGSITKIFNTHSYIYIHEIAQPIVVEYNKEISNPLTTEPLDIAQLIISASTPITTSINTAISLSLANVNYSNMSIENGTIKIKADKLYRISLDNVVAINSGAGGFSFFLCGINSNSLAVLSDMVPATSTLNKAVSNGGYILYQPTSDINVSIMSNTALSSLSFNLTVEEIRNNPVNQYGGFESKVLFDGSASNIGNYTLLDNIENYNFILTEVSLSNTSLFNIYTNNNLILVKNISYSKPNQFYYNGCTSTAARVLSYSFSANNILRIDSYTFDAGITLSLTKIIGIKGQLPTLLQGGEF